MTKRRAKADGLPYRLYERRGVRTYSIGYKLPSGVWAFRLTCEIKDKARTSQLRIEAVNKATGLAAGSPILDTVETLISTWFSNQESLPLGSEERRAESTLLENRREAHNLNRAFGHMRTADMVKADAYTYLDACSRAKPVARPEKGNKEISLMRTILELAVRVGTIPLNPFDGVKKLRTTKKNRYVTDDELDLALEVARELGGPKFIVALALKTAYLCVRRSVEVRALTSQQITDSGIVWVSAKRQGGQVPQHGLIEWSEDLRSVINEALAIKRNKLAGDLYIFGNLQGQRYTKGGWKKTLSELMKKCVERSIENNVSFEPFSLQDCRPKGVSDKLMQKHSDVMDATMHSSERMIRQVYDRRRVKVAKPTH